MNTASVLPWVAVLPGSVALILGLLNIVKEWRTGDEGRRAEAFAKRSEGAAKASEATAVEHRVWMEGSQGTIARLADDCRNCREELNRFENGIDGLFEDIEDQIEPMLMLLGPEHRQILEALHSVVRKARRQIRPPHLP